MQEKFLLLILQETPEQKLHRNTDPDTLSFSNFLSSCCVQGQWYHQGADPLGRPWQKGDVVGCLVDMAGRTMMVTLNGELLFNDRGSEIASKDFDISNGKRVFIFILAQNWYY